MRVSELYHGAIALISAVNNDESYQVYKIPLINQCLADLFDVGNQMLASEGKPRLYSIPTVAYDTDTVPYGERLCKDVMVWRLAQYLIMDDNDPRYNVFENEYTRRLGKYNLGVPGLIGDFYE